MKAIILTGISAVAVTVAAVEASALTVSPEFNSLLYPHLAELNQSQTVETLSLADGIPRLPASAYKMAAVHFVTNDGGIIFSEGTEFTDETIKRCQDSGYTLTSCNDGSPVDVCPYNSSYFKSCCASDYKYNADDCAYPLTRSTESCGGKYKCSCDSALYPFNSCTAPQIPASDSGSSCVLAGKIYYSSCVCPESYTENCNSNNLQGKGAGCVSNGETKYIACECKAGYNLTCSGAGSTPAKPTDYCLKDGIKYYNDCKTCENKCNLETCPVGTVCDYEDCSKKYCPIGCAMSYINWCISPITDCMTLGYTKTAADCTSYGYIKCPYSETAVFCDND